jgi:alpha-mannosidase
MKKMKRLCASILAAAVAGVLFNTSLSSADTDLNPPDHSNGPKLYVVGYSHLDTQWRWSYPQVISEFLRNTLHDNFKLFDKYPHYIFNFTGANRYMMFKEYYPADYETLKKCIADGRWFPGGSSMEEGDVNMPDGESLIRQVLYGNEYFRREFNKTSSEFMLPDCFGFQATLPSILAHCGLKGFSTQKLTWGSAVGIPFNVGVWDGPDGKSIVAALNCTAYTSTVDDDLSNDHGKHGNDGWVERVQGDAKHGGPPIDYRYYGAGDRGGAPIEKSLKNLEKSVTGNGPVHVISATSAQMFDDLTPEQIAKLPHYKGDLLLTGHSTGELSSEAFMKRCERKIENLADAAERASVAADWLGSAAYPLDKINAAWTLALGAQFHDTMAGTALPKSYEYSWNNEILSLNQFAAVTEDASGAIIKAMDTQAQGVPVVVYNPLTIDRQDVADATITVPDTFKDTVAVYGPDGKTVPSQVVSHDGNQLHVLFLAKAPSVGFAAYDVRPASDEAKSETELKVTENTLENARFKVTIDGDGDIASIYDKANHRETLSAPARLELLHENPEQWPAWNMDYADRMHAPVGYVTGPAQIRVVESGPARVAIEVVRQAKGSVIRQTIRLSAGAAGDKVEVANLIDWQTQETSLEAVFPLVASNELATYESQSAAVQRGNNNPKKFEVPQQQWFDLTDHSGNFGTSILNDCKYGSDKPNDNTVRLTLLYTPGTRGGYQDQGSQDLGRHEMVYAIAPHADGWQQGGTAYSAERLNQPLLTFQAPAHEGPLSKSMSLCKISSDHVTAMAIKKAEDSDEIIVRLHELDGQPAENVQVSFASPIQSAREVDGQEREIGKASVNGNGHLSVDMKPFSLRAFAVKLAPASAHLSAPVSQPIALAFDLDAVSSHEKLNDGAFDSEGHTYAGEAFPDKIVDEGITFQMGSKADGEKNAMICKGQAIPLPAGSNRVYFLASAADADVPATFLIDGQPQSVTIQDWANPIGEWDNRLWQGMVPGLTYNWKNKLAGLVPGFVKPAEVAWFTSHRHDPERGNEYYKFTYLFKYGFDLPAGAKQLTLPDNDKVRIFAMSASTNANDDIHAARPLYDTLANHRDTSVPTFSPNGGKFSDTVTVNIQHPLYWKIGSLHYTLDGTEPTAASPVYSQPLQISDKVTIRAKEIDGPDSSGPTMSATFDVNDTTPPVVLSALSFAGAPTVGIHFSKPLKKEAAERPDSYHFQPALKVQSAALSDSGTEVQLTLAGPAQGESYRLSMTGLVDLSPNANAVASTPVSVSVNRPVFSLDSLAAGNSLEKKVTGLPTKAGDEWTINVFVKPNKEPDDRTIIAGFGHDEDTGPAGRGRYLSKFSEGLHFWSKDQDAEGTTGLSNHRWQMLSAVFDGKTVRLYKNGEPVGEESPSLADDESVVEIAPLDPWDHTRRFDGEIRDFTIWKSALPAAAMDKLMESMPK